MLCRSIAASGFENIEKLLKGAEMAEIRIEKSGLTPEEVNRLFQLHPNLIATCRDENLNNRQRLQLLTAAVHGGAQWIDIEVESDDAYRNQLIATAKEYNCKVIVSYHNYENTPDADRLNSLVKECREKGAYLVKVAVMAKDAADAARILALYDSHFPTLAIAMGQAGKITRVAALKLGAPFTFVSCDTELETAPGQISETEMKQLLNNL